MVFQLNKLLKGIKWLYLKTSMKRNCPFSASHIKQYQPICLLNVSFKIFTKVMVNRMTGFASKLISPSQTSFMPSRNIMEGVVMLHETIHEIHRKKMSGVILKLDFEKAYDKVNWEFLHQTLRIKGFSNKWCNWKSQIISKGSVGVKLNDNISRYFQTKKGLRYGDSLSPLLFNLVADILSTLIIRAKDDGQVRGLVPHLVDSGISYNMQTIQSFSWKMIWNKQQIYSNYIHKTH
jgi:hypothetical protein